MASTLTQLYVHIVFSTKHRAPSLTAEFEPALIAYLGGICRNLDSPLLISGVADDHVHLLVAQAKTIALSDLVMTMKKESSKWMKLAPRSLTDFAWQDGYSAFSVSASGIPAIRAYFASQREHHKTTSFRDELVAFCKKYNVPFDERYIVD